MLSKTFQSSTAGVYHCRGTAVFDAVLLVSGFSWQESSLHFAASNVLHAPESGSASSASSAEPDGDSLPSVQV